MEVISIKKGKISGQEIKKIVASLKTGAVLIYPTETAYAIGGDALNQEVIKKIYTIKKRSAKLPLPVIVSDLIQAKKYAYFDDQLLLLAKRFWPGALTMVLKKKKIIPSNLTAGRDSLAIRVSGSRIARTIAKELGRPIISTSANSSRQKECYSVNCIKKQIKDLSAIGLIVDIGKLPDVKPSTIVKKVRSKLVILREGSVNINN